MIKENRTELWEIVNDFDAINHPIDDKEARKISNNCFERLLKLAEKINEGVKDDKETNRK